MNNRTWDLKYDAELDKLLALRSGQESVKIASLSPSDRARYEGFIGAVRDVLVFVDVYLRGFNSILQSAPETSAVSGDTMHWVHQNAGRSPPRIAGMIATTLCSTLEEFTSELAAIKVTPAVVARLPRAFVSGLRPKVTQAYEIRKSILKAVRPSVRADGVVWANTIRTVFSISLDAATEQTLLLMISFRNEYVHEPAKAIKANTSGEEVFAWAKAVLLLAHDLALET